jgi:ribonuclease P protein component
MLKSQYRLTKKKDFDQVFKNGRSAYSGILGLKYLDNELKDSRFGIIISNRVSKKATERNKLKRQIREIIRSQINKIKPGKDCIFIVLSPILGKSHEEIEESIEKLLQRLRLYKNTLN